MKKSVVTIFLVITLLMICFLFTSCVHAENEIATNNEESVLDNETKSQLTGMIEKSKKDLNYYKEKYGSEAYGITAYVLSLVQLYSIPLCFLGIAISGIYQSVIGIRKLDVKEKGLTLMVTFITVLVICQILPLAFTIVVKFGRG